MHPQLVLLLQREGVFCSPEKLMDSKILLMEEGLSMGKLVGPVESVVSPDRLHHWVTVVKPSSVNRE